MAETLNANALTTVLHLRTYLARFRTTETGNLLSDDELTMLINRISSAIETLCDRTLLTASHTFTIDGDGGRRIRLYEHGGFPITAITSITNLLSGQTIPVRPSVSGIGYVLDAARRLAGLIDLDGYAADAGWGTVQVAATCGYTTVTTGLTTEEIRVHRRALDNLENACLQWASLLFNAPIPSAETVTTEALAFTVQERPVPARVQSLLQPYRRLGIC